MKAAILTNINEPLEIWDLELSPLETGQVLVRVLISGLCGAQLQEIAGHKNNAKFIPHLLGHEGCGIVEQIGPGVTYVKPGDKVIMHWRVSQGVEAANPKYITSQGKILTGGKVNTLSEYTVVSENRLTCVPPDTDMNIAALLGCGLSTAFGVVFKEAKLQEGEDVLITGCGGVGLGIIIGATICKASSIVCMDTSLSPDKERYAKELGATTFINSIEAMKDIKADVVIDTTGKSDIITASFNSLKASGTMILVAQPEPGQSITLTNAYRFFEGQGKKIIATQGGRTIPWIDLPAYYIHCQEHLATVKKMVTHIFPLTEINSAIDLLKSGGAGRIMINTGHE